MYIHIVNFNLKDMSHEEFQKLCDQLAPTFADIPGLASKIWLSDPETNTYGGVYTWKSQEALKSFTRSELFHNIVNHPNFTNITARGFSVLEGPTQVTHGMVQVATT